MNLEHMALTSHICSHSFSQSKRLPKCICLIELPIKPLLSHDRLSDLTQSGLHKILHKIKKCCAIKSKHPESPISNMATGAALGTQGLCVFVGASNMVRAEIGGAIENLEWPSLAKLKVATE